MQNTTRMILDTYPVIGRARKAGRGALVRMTGKRSAGAHSPQEVSTRAGAEQSHILVERSRAKPQQLSLEQRRSTCLKMVQDLEKQLARDMALAQLDKAGKRLGKLNHFRSLVSMYDNMIDQSERTQALRREQPKKAKTRAVKIIREYTDSHGRKVTVFEAGKKSS